jgi:thiol-disulfide isomerase/thioredoxin
MIDIDKTQQLFQQFDDIVKYSVIGTKIGTHINKELSIGVGKVAPNFEFQDIKGNKYNLSTFKNRTVLLHFWSSTCGPCRVENKRIKEISETNKDIVIINVSLDINETQWKKAIEKDGLSSMINTSDLKGSNNKMAQDYYVHGIPTHYLIDKKGLIIGKGTFDEVNIRISNTP